MTAATRLLTPGPTQVPPAVLSEMALPVIHHRTEAFRQIFAQVSQSLQLLFGTQHPVLTITGSGTTAFEAAQISLIGPGQKAITCASGKFGERWQDVYRCYGVQQIPIDVAWGQPVRVSQIEAALARHPDARIVTVVHCETSTATVCDLEAIANLVACSEALLLVDGITSVGALPVPMDAWSIDVLVTGSQKALMVPPGLGYVGLGPRALERLAQVEPGPYYHLDLRRWLASYLTQDLPFTPPVNLIRAQRVALQMIEREGLAQILTRTTRLAAATRAACAAMGLTPISTAPSDSVSGLFYPRVSGVQVDDKQFRQALRQRHGIHIAGGQSGRLGDFAGRIFRISHLGYVSAQDTLAGLEAIEAELRAAGHALKAGCAVQAAAEVLQQA